MIYVVNYGAGNILSITSAIKEINRSFELIDSPVSYESKDVLLIPGVGNFKSASSNLIKQGFGQLKNLEPNNRPFILGICLGMQILFENSSEGGSINNGLGLLPGKVRSIISRSTDSKRLKTNIGWSNFKVHHNNLETPFRFLDNYSSHDFYYVHSYMCLPSNEKFVKACYHENELAIPSVVGCANSRVLGYQFHPEKSGIVGLNFLDKTLHHISNI